MNTVNSYSTAVVRLEKYSHYTGASYGQATGFFLHFRESTFLVSNWHVFSGRHFQLKSIHPPGSAIPGKIGVHVIGMMRDNCIPYENTFSPKPFYFEIKLAVTDDVVQLDGQTHPEFGDDVDLVAFNVDAFEKDANDSGIEFGKFVADDLVNNSFDIRAMHPVFIPGYPILKIKAPNEFPVYKSAYIASEPAVMKGANYFFVDGKTKQGWSGSPVMLNPSAMKPIPVWKSQKKDLTTELLPFAVYSGRDESDPELSSLELGIAWPVKTMVLPILSRLKDAVK